MRFHFLTLYLMGAMMAAFLSSPSPLSAQSSRAANGQLRIVSVATGAPNVDVFVDNQTPARIKNIGFRDASETIELTEGVHNMKVALSGFPISSAIIDQDYQGGADSVYSGIAIGSISTNATITILARPYNLPLSNDSVLVRILHGAADQWDLDATLFDAGGGELDQKDLAWGESRGYFKMPAGEFAMTFGEAGSTPTYLGTGTLQANTAITLIISGSESEGNLGVDILYDTDSTRQTPMEQMLRVEQPSSGNPFRVVDVAQGVPVDVFLDNDAQKRYALAFLDASPSTEDYTGQLNVTLTKPGDPITSPLVKADVTLIDDGMTTLYVVPPKGGGAGQDTVVLYSNIANADFTQQEIDPSKATVRIFHARPGAGGITFRLEMGSYLKEYTNMKFRDATKYTLTPGGELLITIPQLSLTLHARVQQQHSYVIILTRNAPYEAYLLDESVSEAQFPMTALDTKALSVDEESGSTVATTIAPNPTTGQFAVTCTVDRRQDVSVQLVDALGRVVSTVDHASVEAGPHTFVVTAGDAPAGTYSVVVIGHEGRRIASGRVAIVR